MTPEELAKMRSLEKEIKDDFGLVSDIAKVVELINGFKLKE